ncbi:MULTISPECIES: hypothetical protein [Bacillaceae]|uniref:hypothetical protein n=1 Tax=Bacillaceae TaxID=186817 RepID=UPI001E457A02|nr:MULTISPECIES: hypothetical protein [Bacillaceae]MCE4048695.1 hypothetical protein [Bacillus sp. Au-Bac7]MCM3032801.1 hypothetical protein [Niallia sp. MER 6]UPO90806.1 hypothetical protein L8T27_022590 [Niallia sp. Man26]
MAKDKWKGFVALGILLTAIGFILLFFSIKFGTFTAENWLIKQGGADTPTYHLVMKGYINNFLTAGSILFGIGLVTTLVGYFKMLTSSSLNRMN